MSKQGLLSLFAPFQHSLVYGADLRVQLLPHTSLVSDTLEVDRCEIHHRLDLYLHFTQARDSALLRYSARMWQRLIRALRRFGFRPKEHHGQHEQARPGQSHRLQGTTT